MTKVHYATVTVAIETLRKQGFTTDFNLKENVISSTLHNYGADEFDILDVYRYEGMSDPADEACVYAIQSKSGEKGILVTGYSHSMENVSEDMLKKLH